MSSPGIASEPIDAVRSLAEVQLQVQAARAASLDARAMGVVGIDAAVATILADAQLTGIARIVALVMLSISACLALRCLLLDIGERMGPPPAQLLALCEVAGDKVVQRSILEWTVADLQANRRALARKVPRLTAALIFLALAVIFALVGSV